MDDKLVILDELKAGNDKKAGIITLNSPEKLNVLTLEMCELITNQLREWEYDDTIAFVLIKGVGKRAFCAGGDVALVYHSAQGNLGHQYSYAQEFIEAEYNMDYYLHRYTKPLICWANGITMGGGMGIMQGASHRIVTKNTVLAMPEAAIGLHTDVGASYFLSRIKENIGIFIGLTGARLNAADALFCNVADFYIDHSKKSEYIKMLLSQKWTNNPESNKILINDVSKRFIVEVSNGNYYSNIQQNLSVISNLIDQKSFKNTYNNIKTISSNDKWLNECRDNLLYGSPVSLQIIFKQLTESKKLHLKACFDREFIISLNCILKPDLKEGIRALLIDKDRNPAWEFSDIDSCPKDLISMYFKSPWPNSKPKIGRV